MSTVFLLPRAPDGQRLAIAILEDVTERRALEEQLRQSQRMEAIGRLAGGVAHDFNNLLMAIASYCDLAEDGRADASGERLRTSIGGIRGAADRAAELTQQLLAFSRRQVLELAPIDVNAVVAEHAPMIQRLLGEDVAVRLSLDPDVATVTMDAGQLVQVLMNLAVNARDAMADGGTLTIETRERRARPRADDVGLRQRAARAARGERHRLGYRRRDAGADVRALLHDEGDRKRDGPRALDGARHRRAVGRTPERVQRAGRRDRRSRSTCRASPEPLVPTPKPRPPPAPASGRPGASGSSSSRTTTRFAARSPRCSPTSATTSSRRRAPRRRCGWPTGAEIDLLVTDVVMPAMNGRQLAERLLPDHEGMHVLYISGYTDDAVIARGVIDPGTAFLQKPFGADRLAQKIRELLDA